MDKESGTKLGARDTRSMVSPQESGAGVAVASAPASSARVTDVGATGETISTKFRSIGGWVEKPDNPQPELEGAAYADVIVVGGGFAGLNTALELTARGIKVILLEKEFAGFGASGRNAGYLLGGHGLEYDLFLKRLSREQAKKVIAFYDEAVDYVEGNLRKYGIDCDYNNSGTIRAGIHPSQEKRLREGMQTGVDLGSPAQYLDYADMRARGIPPAFLFGCYISRGGTLDPGKYVMALRRTALEAGVMIYENTPLLSYTEGKTVTVKTARGCASADFLVFATNAYTPQLGLLQNKVMPIRVSAIETEPLSAAQLATLGWPRREGLITPHFVMESYRLTPRNTLLVTVKRLNYVYGARTPNVPDEYAYQELAVGVRDRFPTLREIAVRSCWSGYISVTYDAVPLVGETGEHRNILYSAGCAGHGLGTQSLAGKLLADKIGGTEHPLYSGLQHKTPTILPEPLQWCAIKSAMAGAHMMDDYVNHKARNAAVRGNGETGK